ncbi:MAG: hypothetical protein ACI855_004835, partial [Myxococcota bacterium]
MAATATIWLAFGVKCPAYSGASRGVDSAIQGWT